LIYFVKRDISFVVLSKSYVNTDIRQICFFYSKIFRISYIFQE